MLQCAEILWHDALYVWLGKPFVFIQSTPHSHGLYGIEAFSSHRSARSECDAPQCSLGANTKMTRHCGVIRIGANPRAFSIFEPCNGLGLGAVQDSVGFAESARWRYRRRCRGPHRHASVWMSQIDTPFLDWRIKCTDQRYTRTRCGLRWCGHSLGV